MATKTKKPGPSRKIKSKGALLPSERDILTLAEAAAYLRVSEDGLKAEAASGKVPSRLVVGEWRFSRKALLDWVGHTETKPLQSNIEKKHKSTTEQLLALSGVWKDDPTVDAMVEEIYRQRKLHPVGGS